MRKLERLGSDALPILITVAEVATVLRIGRTAAWELIREHKIPSVKIGRTRRVPVSAIQEYVEQLLETEVAQ
jgi:excisionase family DNA binding protein